MVINEAFAAQMAWPMERPFYSEEVRQAAVGSREVKKSQTNDRRKIDRKARQNSVNFILISFRLNLCFILHILIYISLVV
jgi:hypothetical protein